jgi:DNA-binding NarL/FixJ family response regulator
MTLLALTSAERTSVAVRAEDEISRAGLLAQLRHRQEVHLLHGAEEDEATAVVVLADAVDDETLRIIRASRRGGVARVVLVATRIDDAALLAAVEAGACSLLLRGTATVDAIVEAIRVAACGSGSMPSELLGRLLDQVRRLQRDVLGPRGLSFSGLTERETKVLRLIADGYDTVEVGRRLFYSDRTVKNIIHDITSRLNLRNRTHAVAYAVRQGLI